MNKEKQIMKFDAGADGFQAMIYVLAFMAVVVLVLGGIFIYFNFFT